VSVKFNLRSSPTTRCSRVFSQSHLNVFDPCERCVLDVLLVAIVDECLVQCVLLRVRNGRRFDCVAGAWRNEVPFTAYLIALWRWRGGTRTRTRCATSCTRAGAAVCARQCALARACSTQTGGHLAGAQSDLRAD